VLGILRDKNWREIMDILCPVMDCTIVTSPPSAPAERAWNPSEAFDYGLIRGWAMKLLPDLNVAIATAAEAGATVVIAGSFHTVGDALLSGSLR
jgi:dihydrofolate synthase/folylpolyglutamate synthase